MHHFPWIKYVDNEYVFYYEYKNRRCIVIRFSEDCIRFYQHNKDIEDPTFPENQHIASIDLSSPKAIGNDLLDIIKVPSSSIKGKVIIKAFNNFIRVFVSEIENDEGIFASSLIANRVREKLQTSIIYKLIAAKNRYETYITQEGLDKYEYKRIVSEYADLLMSPKLSSILPYDKVGEIFLFENPEYELQKIIDKNNQRQNSQKPHEIAPNVIRKIQDFFLRKHSTISAYTASCTKSSYKWLIGFMGAWSLVFIICCFFIKHQCFYWISAILGFLICLWFFFNGLKNNTNSLFPRIIIATIASWLLIGINDDFIASQINVSKSKTIISVIVCLVIIVLILFKECRGHSPYYQRKDKLEKKECNFKILPILSFSLFLSIFIGIIVQLATFQSLIRTNNVLPSVEFSANFTEVEHYKMHTQLLINNLATYKIEILHDEHNKIKRDTTFHKRRCETIKALADTVMNTSLSCNHNHLLDSIIQYKTINKVVIQHKNVYIDSLSIHLHENIVSLNHFSLTYCNTDSLLKIVCQTDSFKPQGNDGLIYEQFFKQDVKENKKDITCVQISSCDKEPLYLFPRTLIFHSFIVLLIAFVVQIIVSGKTVTEGL